MKQEIAQFQLGTRGAPLSLCVYVLRVSCLLESILHLNVNLIGSARNAVGAHKVLAVVRCIVDEAEYSLLEAVAHMLELAVEARMARRNGQNAETADLAPKASASFSTGASV